MSARGAYGFCVYECRRLYGRDGEINRISNICRSSAYSIHIHDIGNLISGIANLSMTGTQGMRPQVKWQEQKWWEWKAFASQLVDCWQAHFWFITVRDWRLFIVTCSMRVRFDVDTSAVVEHSVSNGCAELCETSLPNRLSTSRRNHHHVAALTALSPLLPARCVFGS